MPKPPTQTLFDVVADIPGLLQDSDELQSQTDGLRTGSERNLCDRMLSTLGMLFTWRFQFEKAFPNMAYSVAVEPSTVLSHLQIPEVYASKSFWFTRFDRAQDLLCYNAAVLVVLQLLEAWDISARMSEVFSNGALLVRPLGPLQSLLLPSPGITLEHVLEEIHRSVAYFLHPMHSRSGFLALFSPLWCWYVIHLIPLVYYCGETLSLIRSQRGLSKTAYRLRRSPDRVMEKAKGRSYNPIRCAKSFIPQSLISASRQCPRSANDRSIATSSEGLYSYVYLAITGKAHKRVLGWI